MPQFRDVENILKELPGPVKVRRDMPLSHENGDEKGRVHPNGLVVFGSLPGEVDTSQLWSQVMNYCDPS